MPVLILDWRELFRFDSRVGESRVGMALFALRSLNVLYDENVTIKDGQKEAFWVSPLGQTFSGSGRRETSILVRLH